MADAGSGHLRVDGGRVFYEVAGAGPAIVLTHDGLLHRETWDAQLTTFARDHRVARWDRRGYGLSDPPEDVYSSADDLARVARFVSDSPVLLVGCSFGGLVSLHCALERPELVAALVLVGPIVSGLDFTEHALTRGGRGLPAREAPVAEQIAYWSGIDPWFVAPTNIGARQRLRELLEANPHNLRGSAGLERTSAQPALARLGQLAVPTLIVVGEQDIPDVHAHCGAIAAGIPGARRVVLTGSGHLPQLEVPDAFNATVLTFLADLG
jgi:pimeloyl-ACP methyl ester carboxylesterase